MAVKASEKDTLQQQWDESEAAKGPSQSDIPDGVYQFEIVSVAPSTGNKSGLVSTLKVVGGNEAFEGETISIRDNLDTSENMGWFKQKMKRLGLDPADWTDLDAILASSETEGSLGAAMVGLKFEGQKKSKGGFDNVYVNKLLSSDGAGAEESAAEETPEETPEAVEGEPEVGTEVTFTSKKDGDLEGTVAEVFDGENEDRRVRIDASNGKRYNVPLDAVTVKAGEETETAAEETEETEEEEAPAVPTSKGKANGHRAIPKYQAAKGLKMPEIKAILASWKVNADKIAKPREFLSGIAGMVHNAKYVPDMAELSAMCAGLGVAKKAKPSETVAAVRKAVAAKFK